MISTKNLPNKLPDENIIKIIRRSGFVLLRKVVWFVLIIILPIIFFRLVIIQDNTDIVYGLTSRPIIILSASFYYLFIWLLFFFTFIDYYLDVWIITNQRIIDIEQQGFFSRTISELMIYRIQDVTSEIKGVIPTFLNYGKVDVQTAGEFAKFTFFEIANPEDVCELIIKITEDHKNQASSKESTKD